MEKTLYSSFKKEKESNSFLKTIHVRSHFNVSNYCSIIPKVSSSKSILNNISMKTKNVNSSNKHKVFINPLLNNIEKEKFNKCEQSCYEETSKTNIDPFINSLENCKQLNGKSSFFNNKNNVFEEEHNQSINIFVTNRNQIKEDKKIVEKKLLSTRKCEISKRKEINLQINEIEKSFSLNKTKHRKNKGIHEFFFPQHEYFFEDEKKKNKAKNLFQKELKTKDNVFKNKNCPELKKRYINEKEKSLLNKVEPKNSLLFEYEENHFNVFEENFIEGIEIDKKYNYINKFEEKNVVIIKDIEETKLQKNESNYKEESLEKEYNNKNVSNDFKEEHCEHLEIDKNVFNCTKGLSVEEMFSLSQEDKIINQKQEETEIELDLISNSKCFQHNSSFQEFEFEKEFFHLNSIEKNVVNKEENCENIMLRYEIFEKKIESNGIILIPSEKIECEKLLEENLEIENELTKMFDKKEINLEIKELKENLETKKQAFELNNEIKKSTKEISQQTDLIEENKSKENTAHIKEEYKHCEEKHFFEKTNNEFSKEKQLRAPICEMIEEIIEEEYKEFHEKNEKNNFLIDNVLKANVSFEEIPLVEKKFTSIFSLLLKVDICLLTRIIEPYYDQKMRIGVWLFCDGNWKLFFVSENPESIANGFDIIIKAIKEAQLICNWQAELTVENIMICLTGLQVFNFINLNKVVIEKAISWLKRTNLIVLELKKITYEKKIEIKTESEIHNVLEYEKESKDNYEEEECELYFLEQFEKSEENKIIFKIKNEAEAVWIYEDELKLRIKNIIFISNKELKWWSSKHILVEKGEKAVFRLILNSELNIEKTFFEEKINEEEKKLNIQIKGTLSSHVCLGKTSFDVYKETADNKLKLICRTQNKNNKAWLEFEGNGNYIIFCEADAMITFNVNSTKKIKLEFLERITKQNLLNEKCQYVSLKKEKNIKEITNKDSKILRKNNFFNKEIKLLKENFCKFLIKEQ